jgi:hypothetical protein
MEELNEVRQSSYMEKLEKVQSRNASNNGGSSFVSGSLLNARQSILSL